jgi:hypothetical protein
MPDEANQQQGAPRSKDEVALELMKFISLQTGYGKGAPAAGFGGKSSSRTPEDHASALLELFERCRKTVHKDPA